MTLGLNTLGSESIDGLRYLTAADLTLLSSRGSAAASRPAGSHVQRISARHRLAARLIADGRKNYEVAAACGFAESTITLLKGAPAMQDLIRHFQEEKDLVLQGVNEKLSAVAQEALNVLQDRLENSPEDISTGQIIELAKLGTDRTGYGPQSSSNVNVNVNLADRLKVARERVAAKIIDITPMAAE